METERHRYTESLNHMKQRKREKKETNKRKREKYKIKRH